MESFLVVFLRFSTWRMAGRNLWRNPRRTLVVLAAISIGLAGVLVAMAFNYGMSVQMVDTAIRTELGHVQIHAAGWSQQPGIGVRMPEALVDALRTAAPPELRALAPRVRGEALAGGAHGNAGVSLLAVDPLLEPQVTDVDQALVRGRWFGEETRRALLGMRLAERLKLDVGDKLVVVAEDALGEFIGEAFRVGGLYRTASLDFDERVVLLRLDDGQRMLGIRGEISELALLAAGHDQADALHRAVLQNLPGAGPAGPGGGAAPDTDRPEDAETQAAAAKAAGEQSAAQTQTQTQAVESQAAAPPLGAQISSAPFEVETWQELRPFLRYMVDVYQQMSWFVYAAVFIAMAFGIANVLLMAVYERIREFGVMMAVGMRPGRLVAGLLAESLLLTLLGVAGGMSSGLLGVYALSDGIDLSRFAQGLMAFGIPTRIVPVLPDHDLVIPVVVAVVTALVAGIWPALHAVRLNPAEALRHT